MEEIAAKDIPEISISIVSHAQINLVETLLDDIDSCCRLSSIELIVTLNIGEVLPENVNKFTFPIKVIRNSIPQGFAANHNQAFEQAAGSFFCVMNPDVRLNDNPFPALLACLENSSVGVVAPIIVDASGTLEDSARRFPSPFTILGKVFATRKSRDYEVGDETVFPDWVGGMFMLLPRAQFKQLGGFDQRYFLYYEDVDLCARLRLSGYEVALCPHATAIHQARRDSHRKFRYLKWHMASMVRFFCSMAFLKISWQRSIRSLRRKAV